MTALWLVGAMGTGKTTAGRLAATDLGVPFWDTDELVESGAGATVAEIWDRNGEEAFRDLETAVVTGLSGSTGIISTGGGAVVNEANRRSMTGRVVWLKASPETLAGRIHSHGRPLLAGSSVPEAIAALIDQRESLYESVATDVVDTDGLDARAVADRIVRLWTT